MIKRILLIITLCVSTINAAKVELDIIRKNSTIPNISILILENTKNISLTNKIKVLLEKDLEVSGHFNVITTNEKLSSTENFQNFQNSSDLLLSLSVSNNVSKKILVDATLFDKNKNSIVFKKTYKITNKNRYPFLSHKIAIQTNDYLNAPSIKWMDRFVIFSRYLDARKSEIVVADYTLTYQKVVVKGGLNIFPKWANIDQDSFYYTSYKGLYPAVIKQGLYTSKTEKIAQSDGMIVCSDVTADGSKILLTMAPNGQPDIYVYGTKTKVKTRITKYKGIDIGANFLENDKKIVFVSDRLGKPNIFAKKINGQGVERLVYHGRNNSQATSFKDYIIYSSRETKNEFGRNVFNLYLISTKTDYIKQLTTNGQNQFPKFSSDGESLLFIKNYKNKSYLGILRLNYNKSYLFTLNVGKLQSIDW